MVFHRFFAISSEQPVSFFTEYIQIFIYLTIIQTRHLNETQNEFNRHKPFLTQPLEINSNSFILFQFQRFDKEFLLILSPDYFQMQMPER